MGRLKYLRKSAQAATGRDPLWDDLLYKTVVIGYFAILSSLVLGLVIFAPRFQQPNLDLTHIILCHVGCVLLGCIVFVLGFIYYHSRIKAMEIRENSLEFLFNSMVLVGAVYYHPSSERLNEVAEDDLHHLIELGSPKNTPWMPIRVQQMLYQQIMTRAERIKASELGFQKEFVSTCMEKQFVKSLFEAGCMLDVFRNMAPCTHLTSLSSVYAKAETNVRASNAKATDEE